MQRIVYILLGVGVVVAAFVVVFFYLRSHPTTTPITEPYVNPYIYQDSGTSNTSQSTLTLQTTGGEAIQTKDFKSDSSTHADTINKGHYYLGYYFDEQGVSDANPPYVIEYIDSTQFFSIALLKQPIGAARLAAEDYLIKHLGITEDQMCRLKYMVSVPSSVDTNYAGTSLEFSFCQGSVALPLTGELHKRTL